MLTLEHVAKAYGRQTILRDISIHLERGQIGCLLGPSGCGKTTALRLIAGFETLQAGRIVLDGELVSAPAVHLAAERRRVGLMFQDYALFPHLTVAANIAFGLGGLGRTERKLRVEEMLRLVDLMHVAHHYPHQLSGGQQQRVALARALAPRPRLLLLDEAFSNLDVELREKLALEVRDILKHEGMTALLVTHNQHEAFALADVVGVLNDGVIQQWASPYLIYHQPRNRFIAGFIGQGVLLPGTLDGSGRVAIELGKLSGITSLSGETAPAGIESAVEVLIRPDDIEHDDTSPLQAIVEQKVFRGADFLYRLRLPSGSHILAQVPSHHNHAIGEKIGIRLHIDHVVAFHRQSS